MPNAVPLLVSRRMKAGIRDAIPAAWRVPAKYWHARVTGTLEPEMRLLGQLIERGERAIDIGGNFGAYAFALARLGTRVEVFEPNGICLRALDAWAAGQPAVTIHPFALSATPGLAALVIPVEADGTEHDAAGSIEPGQAASARSETVAVRTLDSFGFDDAALIKIDVEGHEAATIEGALATIAASSPALLVEIEQRHRAAPIQATFDRITGFGYRGYFLRDGRLVDLADFDPAVHQSRGALGESAYVNNFLFLADARLQAGAYRALTFARPRA